MTTTNKYDQYMAALEEASALPHTFKIAILIQIATWVYGDEAPDHIISTSATEIAALMFMMKLTKRVRELKLEESLIPSHSTDSSLVTVSSELTIEFLANGVGWGKLVVDRLVAKSLGLHLFFGLIQLGKSGAAIRVAHLSQLHDYTTIYFVMNRTNQVKQLYKRYSETVKNLDSKYIPLNYAVLNLNANITGDTTRDELDDTADEDMNKIIEFLNPKSKQNGTIICMTNKFRLNSLNKIYELARIGTDETQPLVAIVDESDSLCSTKKEVGDRKMNIKFSEIFNKCTTSFGFTATPMKMLRDTGFNITETTILPASETYLGISDFSIITTYTDDDTRIKRGESVFEAVPTIEKFFEDTSKKSPYFIKTDTGIHILPVISLISVSAYIKHHNEILDHMVENRKKYGKFTTIVWNGTSTRIFCSTLYDEGPKTIKIPVYGDKAEYSTYERPGYYTFKSCQISDILQFLKDNGGHERFGNIFIVAGMYCDRGISYMSTDYTYFLTQQFYIPTPTAVLDTCTQYMRLCGDYRMIKDNVYIGEKKIEYKPTLYTTTAVAKSLKTYMEIVGASVKAASEAGEESISECVSNLEFAGSLKNFKKMFKSRHVDTKMRASDFSMDGRSDVNISAAFTDLDLEHVHDGMYMKEAKPRFKHFKIGKVMREEMIGRTLGGDEVAVVGDEEMLEGTDYPKKEYIRLTQKMFPKWSKERGSKISEFMHDLDPEKEYTTDEVEHCVSIKNITNTLESASKGYGKIIQKIDGHFKLYECLVEEFKKYF